LLYTQVGLTAEEEKIVLDSLDDFDIHRVSGALRYLQGHNAICDVLVRRIRKLEGQTHQCQKDFAEIEQTLGKALGCPWFKDDQVNFPGATEENGVCVGEHVPTTIAMEAARKIEELKNALARWKTWHDNWMG
jgi:iron-sulfur cluster repair protein YtfE (RIC family)